MKLLVVIPHYCGLSQGSVKYGSQSGKRVQRGQALRRAVLALHQTLGNSQAMIQVGDRCTIDANHPLRHSFRVLVVTNEVDHALHAAEIPQPLYEQVVVDCPSMHLGFACHQLLGKHVGDFDYYAYLEDDLVIHDPWFIEKLIWFNRHVGVEKLLLPQRFELACGLAYQKCYLDGDLNPHVTKPFQDVTDEPRLKSHFLGRSIEFIRPLNPHAGCFFLNAGQMHGWVSRSDFGVAKKDFVGPLESAATLSLMQSFKVYKPATNNANFFEIEHHGDQFIRKIRRT